MILPFVPADGSKEPRGLVGLFQVPGQRWHHLWCSGQKSHYRVDGSCIHTDYVIENMLTERGKKVTKLVPFCGGRVIPKRYANTPAARSVAALPGESEG